MATPIIQSVGVISGAGVAGRGRDDLVAGERVNLSDAEGANSGATYFWEFEDVPIGTSPTMNNHTTATPHFFVDPDPLLAGSYRVKCTVNGIDFSTEVFAKPLAITGARIPSFEEQNQYDEDGNVKGWHAAQTHFMRRVDEFLAENGVSTMERTGAVVVPNGTNVDEIEFGAVIYPGSLLAIGVICDEPVTAGTIDFNVKIGGVTAFTAQLSTGSPSTAFDIHPPGDFPIVQGDRLSVEADANGMTTGSTNPLPVSIVLVISNVLTGDVLSFTDASNTQKGLVKLSVAPAVADEPVAVGTNDTRIPDQAENDALAGTSGVPSGTNRYVTNSDSRMTDGRAPSPHSLAGAAHTADTLANLNSKISDATLIDTNDARLSNARTPTAHASSHVNGGSDEFSVAGLSGQLADPQTPLAHALGGAAHSAGTLAELDALVSDATLARTDAGQAFTGAQRIVPVALTDGASIAIDASLSNVFTVTLAGNRAFANPTNVVAGVTYTFVVTQDGAGGRTLSYGANFSWGDEGTPVLSTGIGKVDIISAYAISSTKLACTILKGF